VVGLRWIGYGVLLFVAWRLAGAVRLRVGKENLAVANFCAPVLMVAALTCYSAGMRTPCYNWMILVGAILAWSGWLRSGISGVGPLELGIGDHRGLGQMGGGPRAVGNVRGGLV
jgi:hypothetical protein